MSFTCIPSVQHTQQFPLHATNSAVVEVDHSLLLELKDQQNMWTSVTSAVNQSIQEHKTPTPNPQQYTATVDSVSQAIEDQWSMEVKETSLPTMRFTMTQKVPVKQDGETTEDILVSKSLCLPSLKA